MEKSQTSVKVVAVRLLKAPCHPSPTPGPFPQTLLLHWEIIASLTPETNMSILGLYIREGVAFVLLGQ